MSYPGIPRPLAQAPRVSVRAQSLRLQGVWAKGLKVRVEKGAEGADLLHPGGPEEIEDCAGV